MLDIVSIFLSRSTKPLMLSESRCADTFMKKVHRGIYTRIANSSCFRVSSHLLDLESVDMHKANEEEKSWSKAARRCWVCVQLVNPTHVRNPNAIIWSLPFSVQAYCDFYKYMYIYVYVIITFVDCTGSKICGSPQMHDPWVGSHCSQCKGDLLSESRCQVDKRGERLQESDAGKRFKWMRMQPTTTTWSWCVALFKTISCTSNMIV
jgi:hypothetical protein